MIKSISARGIVGELFARSKLSVLVHFIIIALESFMQSFRLDSFEGLALDVIRFDPFAADLEFLYLSKESR